MVLVAVRILLLKRKNNVKREHPEKILVGMEGLPHKGNFILLGDKHLMYRHTY
jgi:hypothetical protein